MAWIEIFVAAPFIETEFSEGDPLQKKMVSYAKTTGAPTEENALSDNFGRWGRTLSAHVKQNSEALAKESNEAAEVGNRAARSAVRQETKRIVDSARVVTFEKLLKPRGGDLREFGLAGGGDLLLRVAALHAGFALLARQRIHRDTRL